MLVRIIRARDAKTNKLIKNRKLPSKQNGGDNSNLSKLEEFRDFFRKISKY